MWHNFNGSFVVYFDVPICYWAIYICSFDNDSFNGNIVISNSCIELTYEFFVMFVNPIKLYLAFSRFFCPLMFGCKYLVLF